MIKHGSTNWIKFQVCGSTNWPKGAGNQRFRTTSSTPGLALAWAVTATWAWFQTPRRLKGRVFLGWDPMFLLFFKVFLFLVFFFFILWFSFSFFIWFYANRLFPMMKHCGKRMEQVRHYWTSLIFVDSTFENVISLKHDHTEESKVVGQITWTL